MPLDNNAPKGMLRWISEEDPTRQVEVTQTFMFQAAMYKQRCKEQLALPPEQRDPAWVRGQQIRDEVETEAEYRKKTGYFDMDPSEWERRERKKMMKRANGGGWFRKLFGL